MQLLAAVTEGLAGAKVQSGELDELVQSPLAAQPEAGEEGEALEELGGFGVGGEFFLGACGVRWGGVRSEVKCSLVL